MTLPQNTLVRCSVSCLVTICIFIHFSLAGTNKLYYIIPSPSTPCPKQTCYTLSYFANNITLNTSNATLLFLPGSHRLDSKLVIANMKDLILSSKTISHSNISCSGTDASFELSNIDHVEVSELEFIGCGGNRFGSVCDLSIRNVKFQGYKGKNTLEITWSIVIAIHTHFISDSMNGPLGSKSTQNGGAIIMKQSTVNFISCTFENNSAEIGGAIYGKSMIKLTITESIFIGNKAILYNNKGGAIFYDSTDKSLSNCHSEHKKNKGRNRQESGILEITNTTFINNKAEQDGGAIAVIHSNLFLYTCRFKNNTARRGGGIFAINFSSVIMSGSEFINCNGTSIYGHGGAVYTNESLLLINSCQFKNNFAAYGGAVNAHYNNISIVNCNFTHNMATYQGGALYVFYISNMTLDGCYFNTNIVISPTGVGSEARLYKVNLSLRKSMFLGQENVVYNWEEQNIHIPKCPQNKSNRIIGVALVIGYSKVRIDNTTLTGRCMSLYTYNCSLRFMGNVTFSKVDSIKSTMPGALSTIQSTVAIHGKLSLVYNSATNGGAIHAVESQFDVHGNLSIEMNKAMDSGGGIYLYRSELKCRETSNVTIVNNKATEKGGGIDAISSSITVIYMRQTHPARSLLHFVANSATQGGGLHLEANARLYVIKVGSTTNIIPRTSVVFKKNSATHGGAIYVADEASAGVCQSLHSTRHSHITECFLQVTTFNLLEKVNSLDQLTTLEFVNNSAQSGHVLFGGLLDRCTISRSAEVYQHKYINYTNIPSYAYFEDIAKFNANLNSITSKAVRVCLCSKGIPQCNNQPPQTKIRKGEHFSMWLAAVDQVNRTVNNSLIHSSLNITQLDIGQHLQESTEGCTLLHFSISSPSNVTYDTLTLYAEGPCGNAEQSQLRIGIQFDECSCSIGFEQDPDHSRCKCVCDSRLKMLNVSCNSTTESIVKKGNFWIQYINSSRKDGFVIHSPCPTGYCLNSDVELKFNSSNNFSNEQCMNRSGILCGSCLPSHSLSIDSTRCVKCSDAWQGQMVGITLTAIFGGIALVAVIMVLDLTVATGTINGIIFYANIMNSGFIELAAPKFVISWLNLEFGFDVCFINGLDVYWKTWLRLLFPAYIFLLVALIVVISRQSLKFSHLIGKRNPVATLTTLILLSYTNFLRTIIVALSFTTLSYPSGISKTVWLPDANIEYLRGKHIALFIAANLILLVGVAYTLLLFSWQWLLRNQDMWIFKWVRYQKLQNFLEPYHAPYTYQHRYWTGLLLVVRIALYLTSAINVSGDVDVTLYSITILTSALLFLKSAYNRGIYKNTIPNIIETICLINIVLCCTTNLYYRNSNLKVLAYISGTLTTIILLLIVVYHIIINFGIWKKLRSVITSQPSISHRNSGTGPDTPEYTTSVIDGPPSFKEGNSELRESLLESINN